jgi:hypothetical protein
VTGREHRQEPERLCWLCAAIHVTEGQIPAYCRECDPPRIPERKDKAGG